MITGTLAGILNTEPWVSQAICAPADGEAFFPERGNSSRDAKKVCAACPVRQQCLQHALRKAERYGIWGALSERERRELRAGRLPTHCRCGHEYELTGKLPDGACFECARIQFQRRTA